MQLSSVDRGSSLVSELQHDQQGAEIIPKIFICIGYVFICPIDYVFMSYVCKIVDIGRFG